MAMVGRGLIDQRGLCHHPEATPERATGAARSGTAVR